MSPHTSQKGFHQKSHEQQMLERVQREGDPPALLVGMQTGTAALENGVGIQKLLVSQGDCSVFPFPYLPFLMLLR